MGGITAMPRSKSLTVITPSHWGRRSLLADILEYRELFYALALRDLRVRYKQTVVGAAWAVLQPLALMIVLTIFFGYLVRFPSDGIPYPLFVLCGVLPWQLFARALNDGTMSVVANGALVQKIYFPRVILPGVVIASGLVDFAVALVALFVLMAYYGMTLTVAVFLAPVFVLLAVATALGVSLFFAALDVRPRHQCRRQAKTPVLGFQDLRLMQDVGRSALDHDPHPPGVGHRDASFVAALHPTSRSASPGRVRAANRPKASGTPGLGTGTKGTRPCRRRQPSSHGAVLRRMGRGRKRRAANAG